MTPDAEAIARIADQLSPADRKQLRRQAEGMLLTRPPPESPAESDSSADPAEVARLTREALGRM